MLKVPPIPPLQSPDGATQDTITLTPDVSPVTLFPLPAYGFLHSSGKYHNLGVLFSLPHIFPADRGRITMMPDLGAQLVGVIAHPTVPLTGAQLSECQEGDAECPG